MEPVAVCLAGFPVGGYHARHLLVHDTAFWEDQVRSPANAWVAAGGRGSPKNTEEAFATAQGTESLDPGAGAKRTTKEKRAAKKRKLQAEREELKALRASASGKGKQDNKSEKPGALKSMQGPGRR